MTNQELKAALGRAIEFATHYHKGQTLWCGTPYILHPLEVMMSFHDEQYKERIVAVCHDVIEDTSATIDDFKKHVTDDPEIVTALECMTHDNRFSSYEEYVQNMLALSTIACHVKFYDVSHNMRLTRSSYSRPFSATDSRRNKKLEKYQSTWKKLKEKLNQENIHVSIQ